MEPQNKKPPAGFGGGLKGSIILRMRRLVPRKREGKLLSCNRSPDQAWGLNEKIATAACLMLFTAGRTLAADGGESAVGTFKSQGITIVDFALR